ncbi:MAG: carbohydrate porin [Rhodanobacteraceae bacterium]
MKNFALVLGFALAQLFAGPVLAQPDSQANGVAPVGAATTTGAAHTLGLPPLHWWRQAGSDLQSRGITLGGWLQADTSTVPEGGLTGANSVAGQYLMDLSATVDTERLFGWPGGAFFVDAQLHRGNNILTSQMPAIQDPDNMDANPTTSIDRAWYQQKLLHQKLQVQIGLMYVDDQFLTVPYGQNFVSLDFSSDASLSTFVLPTYPKGSYGADVFVYPMKGLYFSAGVFGDHSTELPYDPGGQLYISEEGWQGNWNAHVYEIQIGVWRDTGTFRRLANGAPRRGASGMYAVASDQLWRPDPSSRRGLGLFVQLGTAPAAVALVRRHYGAGLVWTGPFAQRPKDEIGVAFSDGILTRQNGFTYGFEKEFEAYYRIHVSRGFTVQPDVEYWRHPNGSGRDTTLLLIRFQYSFGAQS